MRHVPKLLTLLVLAVALAGAAALGFEAGRRYPFEFLARFMPARGNAFWTVSDATPFTVYESAVATFGDSVYVFGGFEDVDRNASSAVWIYDASSGSWIRKADMPGARTHGNAAVVGRTAWFAGGFIGQHPGPGTREVWRYDVDADRWTAGTPLPDVRGGGALVALDNWLHYFGGYLADRNTVSALHWKLDVSVPVSARRWVEAAPMPVPRGHVAAAVVDGYAYAIGGVRGHDPYQIDLADVHRYDPRTDTWIAVASLPTPRSHVEPSTFVRDGRIIVIGGRARPTGIESSRDVTEYDPVTNQWSALAPLPQGRVAPIAAPIGDRVIVAAGGQSSALPDTRVTWIGQFESAWEPMDSMPVPLGEVAGGIVGDRLFLIGHDGRETLALDPGTGRWDPLSRHPIRIMIGHHHAAEVLGDSLYIIGGLDGGDGEVQIFDPAQGRWFFGPRMPFAAGSVASAVIGGRLYVAGGIVGDTTTRLAARLDPATGQWRSIAAMPRGRNHAASGTDGSRFYVFGGRGPGSGDANEVANGFDDVQIYDPATDRWTASGEGANGPAPLPQARGGMGKAVFVNGEFWVFGGETLDGPGATSDRVYDRVDIYSPSSNSWRAGPPMPTARHGIFPLRHGERIIVAGGGTRAASSVSHVVEVLDTRRARPPATRADSASVGGASFRRVPARSIVSFGRPGS
jgi:N-acetylneuraminic acid mutarotase